MKILHTSDWHLGARLGRHDRLPDQHTALKGLLATVEEQQPDLILHTGDLFDSPRPSYPALHLGVAVLRRLSAAAPTVVLCGNHDSPRLLRIIHDLAGTERLQLVTTPMVVSVQGLDGVALACMPYVPPSALADFTAGDLTQLEGSYADQIRGLNQRLLDEATKRVGDDGIVCYAAHLHVHGARTGKSERRVTIGDDYATHLEGLHRAHYAAFGHIHDPQELPGGLVTGRYAGSLIPLDFGESEQVKHSVCVEIRDGNPTITTHPLPTGRPLVTFDGPLAELDQRAAGGALNGCLLKARVTSADPIPNLAERLLAASPECLIFDVVNAVANRAVRVIKDNVAVDGDQDLATLFREWRASQRPGQASDEDIVAIFEAALGGTSGPDADLGVSGVIARACQAVDGYAAVGHNDR